MKKECKVVLWLSYCLPPKKHIFICILRLCLLLFNSDFRSDFRWSCSSHIHLKISKICRFMANFRFIIFMQPPSTLGTNLRKTPYLSLQTPGSWNHAVLHMEVYKHWLGEADIYSSNRASRHGLSLLFILVNEMGDTGIPPHIFFLIFLTANMDCLELPVQAHYIHLRQLSYNKKICFIRHMCFIWPS